MRSRPVPIAMRRVLVGGGTIGLAVTVVGTFLPWLGSGTAKRNSYAAGGAVRRLLALGRPVHDMLGAWPLIGVFAAVAVAAALLGHPAVGLAVATMVGLVAGGCAAAVLPVPGNQYVHVLREGPVTTLCGAMLVGLTTLTSLVLGFARRPR